MKFAKYIVGTLLVITIVLTLLYILLPFGPRDPMKYDDPAQKSRPLAEGTEYMVVTGMPYATRAATEVLENGGNAFDAAVAGLLMLNVVSGEAASFPGIAPIIIYDAKTQSVHSYTGAGTAPAAASIEAFAERGHTEVMPDLSILSQLVPASPDVIIALLKDYGTMSFEQVSAAAIETAREGFPVHHIMHQNLNFSIIDRVGFSVLLSYNSEVYLKGQVWRPLHYKDRFTRPDLARTLSEMAQAERDARSAGDSRSAGLDAVRRHFYEGPIAEKIIALHRSQGGLMNAKDLADYRGSLEEPLQYTFRAPSGNYTIYTNETWSQGIAFLMMLNMIQAYGPERLRELGRNSAEYVHTLAQIIDLAMADRDAFAGDPRFVDVPVKHLLSLTYAQKRLEQRGKAAFPELPSAGVPRGVAPGKDTSYLAVVDRAGNAVSLTPSDFPKSPMVPGTGLTLGNRMIQFRLDPESPNALAPGKRPRVTPHALMAKRNGEFYMAFGTPGGDMQTQANLQFLLNHVLFGLDAQAAVEAPRFRSRNFPDSFAPHEMRPSGLDLEAELHAKIAGEVSALSYDVQKFDKWLNHFGGVGAVIRNGGKLYGAADPREGTWAAGK